MPRVRVCAQCGRLTELEYNDDEWEERDFLCEACEDEIEKDLPDMESE